MKCVINLKLGTYCPYNKDYVLPLWGFPEPVCLKKRAFCNTRNLNFLISRSSGKLNQSHLFVSFTIKHSDGVSESQYPTSKENKHLLVIYNVIKVIY